MKENLPVAYKIEYADDQGFAIVAADRRVSPVLCVIESGTYAEAKEIPELGFIIDNMNGYIAYQIERFEAFRDSLAITNGSGSGLYPGIPDEGPGGLVDPGTGSGMGQVVVGGGWTPQPMPCSTYYEYSDWIVKDRISPMLPVEWNQTSPYNDYVDFFWCKDEYMRGKAGCVAIAIGQIMAYHQKPWVYKNYSYNWAEMTRYSKADDSRMDAAVKAQVANLVRTIGSEVNMHYGGCESGALTTNIRGAFRRMGYVTPEIVKRYNLDNVLESFRNHSPVLIVGTNSMKKTGHAWVLDGFVLREQLIHCYRTCKESDGSQTTKLVRTGSWTQTLLRNNWGWGGSCNGFFEAGCFDYRDMIEQSTYAKSTSPSEYDKGLKCIYQVK